MKRSKSYFKYLFSFLVIILLVFIFVNPNGFSQKLRLVTFKIAYPFQKTFYFFGGKIKETTNFWSSIDSLSEENEALIKDNSRLNREIAVLKEVKEENEELRSQLKLAPWQDFNLESAFVIGQNSGGTGSWLVIDKGLNDGIEKGMSVIVFDGILVGKIKEVYADSAQVLLLSDPKSLINVKDVETGARGLIRGEYGLGIFLDMVEQREAINKGDSLITSGLGGDTPENLLIGKIQDIQSSPDKLFQQAIVSPQVKYSELRTVLIIKK